MAKSNSNTLEIIQGLAQAAANVYDGVHDERFTLDGQTRSLNLRREEGCPIMDSRVIDGFSVKFYADSVCINYQSDIRLKEVHGGNFENDINSMLNEIKKFLQKEYKAITGKSIKLTTKGESKILVQSTSRVRSFVQAYQHYKVSGLEHDAGPANSYDERMNSPSGKAIKDFLSLKSDKRPKNDKRKKNDNRKK